MNSTIYIRPEDEDKWRLLENKSLFVHQVLNDLKDLATVGEHHLNIYAKENDLEPINNVAKIFNIPGVTRGSEFVPKPPDPVFGYPCCKAKKPCKHWQWNDLDGAWINSITGEARET